MHALRQSALAQLVLIVMLLFAMGNGKAQSSKDSAPACSPTATLDQLPQAFDAAISGPGNKDRSCLRQLLMPEARISLMVRVSPGVFAPHTLSVEDWINAVSKRGDESLYEREVKVNTETYGKIAHLWCTYELRPTPDGKATSRGIVSVEVAFDDGVKSWKIVGASWQPEWSDGQPIPAKFLP